MTTGSDDDDLDHILVVGDVGHDLSEILVACSRRDYGARVVVINLEEVSIDLVAHSSSQLVSALLWDSLAEAFLSAALEREGFLHIDYVVGQLVKQDFALSAVDTLNVAIAPRENEVGSKCISDLLVSLSAHSLPDKVLSKIEMLSLVLEERANVALLIADDNELLIRASFFDLSDHLAEGYRFKTFHLYVFINMITNKV